MLDVSWRQIDKTQKSECESGNLFSMDNYVHLNITLNQRQTIHTSGCMFVEAAMYTWLGYHSLPIIAKE